MRIKEPVKNAVIPQDDRIEKNDIYGTGGKSYEKHRYESGQRIGR